MIAYVLRKLLFIFLLFLLILTLQFFLFRLAIPDPTIIYIREGLGPEEREIIRRSFGLDRPLYEQYVRYIVNFLRGDMGYSFLYKEPVSSIIIDRLLNTLVLTIPATLTAFLIAFYLGSYMAWLRGSLFEKAFVAALSVVHSLPLFWIGMIAIAIISVHLGLLPAGGMRTPPYEAESFLDKILSFDFLKHWILPYTVLTIYTASYPTLLMRGSMISTLGEDFITTLKAVGFNERIVVAKASRYSILPLITYMGISMGLAFSGSVA
ncbi:MAG: ABC transporter permease, partial [Desulfurococcaceae archaeon]|nr:ABC transporter permease [Desulfurococcaceae archaeon]